MVTKQLADNEKIIVDTYSLVGWQETAEVSVQLAGGLCTICCGGQGLFNTVVTGPGQVVLQSMSFERYRQALKPPEDGGAMTNNPGGSPAEVSMER